MVTPYAAHAIAMTFPITGDGYRIARGCLGQTIRAIEWRGAETAFGHLRACPACAAFYRVFRLGMLLDDTVPTLPRWRIRRGRKGLRG